MVEEFLLVSTLNTSFFNLCSFSIVLPQATTVKSLAP